MGNLDVGALQELEAVRDRLSKVWLAGTNEILEQRNPGLLSELNKAETVLDSLLAIPKWPAPIRKQWQSALADYAKTAMLCVTYAGRHIVKS